MKMTCLLGIITAFLFSLSILSCGGSSGGSGGGLGEWTKENGVRIAGGVSSSTVILPDGTYRMYYQAIGGVKSAVSSDGTTFTEEEGTRLEIGAPGDLDSDFAGNPTVIVLPDGTYRMYYSGRDGTQSTSESSEEQNTIRILSATSADGLTFIKEDGIRIDSTVEEIGINDYGIADVPDAIINSAGEYLMYYVYDWMGANSIHAARSSDGLTWTRFQITTFANDSMDPDVVELADGSYRLYFANFPTPGDVNSGELSIHSSTSPDGVTWTHEGTVLEPTESWERTRIGDPDVVELEQIYRMYYYGMDNDDNSDIVSATSPTGN